MLWLAPDKFCILVLYIHTLPTLNFYKCLIFTNSPKDRHFIGFNFRWFKKIRMPSLKQYKNNSHWQIVRNKDHPKHMVSWAYNSMDIGIHTSRPLASELSCLDWGLFSRWNNVCISASLILGLS